MNTNLKLTRLALHLRVEDAAIIGGVRARTWRRWENGGAALPEDVEQQLTELCQGVKSRARELAAMTESERTPHILAWSVNKNEDSISWRLEGAALSIALVLA